MWSFHILLIGFAVIKIIIAGETPTVAPRWISKPTDKAFTLGSNAEVECKSDGSPKPQIVWRKSVDFAHGEYKEIKSNDNIRVDAGTLYIDNIQKSDEGHYLCEAINGIGFDLIAMISIRVQSPPKLTQQLPNQTARRYGQADLQCKASGDKPIAIIWNIDGEPLDPNTDNRYSIHDEILDNGVISTLTIKPTQRTDSTVFTCVAVNEFDSDVASIILLIQEVPEMPFGLRVLNRKSRILKLGWMKPYDGNSPLKRYIIEFKTSDSSWEHNVNRLSVSADTALATVNSLSPGTRYDFRIAAENEIGVSDPSQDIFVITKEEDPSGKPQDIKVETNSPTSMRVTWKAPPRSEWNGDPLGFYVRCKSFGCPSCSSYFEAVECSREEDDKEYSSEFTNLKPFTQYTISIQAYNAAGAGPWSDEINQYTVQGTPNDRPSMIKCTTINTERIRVGWSSVPFESPNDVVKGYKVAYAPSELWHVEKEKIFSKTATTAKELHGLKKNTNYTIQVLAIMSSGDKGVASSPIHCQTEQDGAIIPELMEQVSFKNRVSCDAENQALILNVDFECQEMILEDLDFEGLVNVSQINGHFSFLANELMRRKYESVDNVLIGNKYNNDGIDDGIGKWSFSNGVLKLQPDFAEDFLRGFGRFIKKLEIYFYHIEDHAKFGHLINTYCSDTLLELTEERANQSFLDAMQKPFKRVERVKIQTDYLARDSKMNLNDLFPSVRYLNLEQWRPKSDPNQDFPIVYKYPNLIDLQISAYVSHFFENLFKLNPYLRKITCDNIESTVPLQIINDHFPELESFGFSILDGFDNHNGPVVNFKHVEDLFITDRRRRSVEINPEKFNFEKLETLRFVSDYTRTTKIEDWLKVIRKHKNIKKLFVKVYVSSDDLLDLTKNLIHLEEASILNGDHETIAQFQQELGPEWNITYNQEDIRFNFTKLTALKTDDAEIHEIKCTEKTKNGSKLLDLLEVANKSRECLDLATAKFHEFYASKTFAIHSPASSGNPIVIDYASLDTVHIHDVETTVNLLKTFGRLITKLFIFYTDSEQYTEISELIGKHCYESLTELHFASFNGNMWSNTKNPFYDVRKLSIGHTIQKNETMKLGELFPNIRELYLDSVESFDNSFVDQTFSCLENLTIKFAPFNGSNYLTPADVGQFLKSNPQIRVLDSNNAEVANYLDGINQLETISLDKSFLNASTLKQLTMASQNFTKLSEVSLLCGADVHGKDVANFVLSNENLKNFTLKLYNNTIRKQFAVNFFDSYKEWYIFDDGPFQYADVAVSDQVHTIEMKRFAGNSNVSNGQIGGISTEQIKIYEEPTTVPSLLPKTTESHSTTQPGLKFKEFYEELDKVLRQISFMDAMKLNTETMQRANEFLKTSKA